LLWVCSVRPRCIVGRQRVAQHERRLKDPKPLWTETWPTRMLTVLPGPTHVDSASSRPSARISTSLSSVVRPVFRRESSPLPFHSRTCVAASESIPDSPRRRFQTPGRERNCCLESREACGRGAQARTHDGLALPPCVANRKGETQRGLHVRLLISRVLAGQCRAKCATILCSRKQHARTSIQAESGSLTCPAADRRPAARGADLACESGLPESTVCVVK